MGTLDRIIVPLFALGALQFTAVMHCPVAFISFQKDKMKESKNSENFDFTASCFLTFVSYMQRFHFSQKCLNQPLRTGYGGVWVVSCFLLVNPFKASGSVGPNTSSSPLPNFLGLEISRRATRAFFCNVRSYHSACTRDFDHKDLDGEEDDEEADGDEGEAGDDQGHLHVAN